MAELRDLLRQHLGMGARNVPRALAMIGGFTWATVAAGVVSPLANRASMYSAATLAPAVIGGGATMFAAIWVSDDLPRASNHRAVLPLPGFCPTCTRCRRDRTL
ncbi:unnamed protein product [Urochloa humidicola]